MDFFYVLVENITTFSACFNITYMRNIMHVTIVWLVLCNCMFNLLLLTSYTYNN